MSVQPIWQYNILLVEDDEDYQFLVRSMLRDIRGTRYELRCASSYEEGLAALYDQSYHVCLLDYHLGGHSGLELLERAQASGLEGPFLLLTAHADRSLDVQAMQSGAVDYLVKMDLTPALLERAIRYAVERQRSLESLRASERRFRALIENSNDPILLIDGAGQPSCMPAPLPPRF